MSLLSEAVARTGHAGGRCAVGRLMEENKEIGAELKEALDADDVSAQGLSLALKDRGIDLGRQAIYRHRRRYCRCTA